MSPAVITNLTLITSLITVITKVVPFTVSKLRLAIKRALNFSPPEGDVLHAAELKFFSYFCHPLVSSAALSSSHPKLERLLNFEPSA